MQLELKIGNTDLADALQRYIEQRLSFELGRYGDRVGRVVVKVSGLSGSRGGTKKSCRISAELEPFGRVALQETDLDLMPLLIVRQGGSVACSLNVVSGPKS